jgi:hypothetical protein
MSNPKCNEIMGRKRLTKTSYFKFLNFSSLVQDPQQRLAANQLKELIEVISLKQ